MSVRARSKKSNAPRVTNCGPMKSLPHSQVTSISYVKYAMRVLISASGMDILTVDAVHTKDGKGTTKK